MSTTHTPGPPSAPSSEPPEGFWRREGSHYPQPLSPLTRSFMIPAINSVFRQV